MDYDAEEPIIILKDEVFTDFQHVVLLREVAAVSRYSSYTSGNRETWVINVTLKNSGHSITVEYLTEESMNKAFTSITGVVE